MSNITELNIVNKDNITIFSNNEITYVIPLYQRAYSWKEKEINQLIDDICDCEDENYFLGSLIVDKKNNKFEVIDGQQRLTTLFLLLKCLNQHNNEFSYDIKNILEFECRERSNHSLICFESLEKEDYFEASILEGKIIINKILKEEKVIQQLRNNLAKVKLYRIEVPNNTDLNRYFEIMNTRGEQLEQHDILKAILLKYIPEFKRNIFAKIWESCSDMTGYVQMHFSKELRESLFASWWGAYPESSFFDEISAKETKKDIRGETIRDIVNSDIKQYNSSINTEEEQRIRFESVIEFPYFLLHALRVYVKKHNISSSTDCELYGKLLDDKKLLFDFKNVIENGNINGEKITRDIFAETFIKELLQLRFIFDKYIIKREFVNENSEGEWSLKTLDTSGQQSNKKAYYKDSDFGCKNEHEKTRRNRHSRIIRLQACYRVSYTSPKVMHWITDALLFASDDNLTWIDYEKSLEQIAKNAVNKDFLENNNFELGVNTPHIVFNYLDYLLWLSNTDKYKDFVFEFRNSVEHWYPQTPSKDTFEHWPQDDGVNRFGNLCLIQRNVNSKFSNMSPEAKKSTFKSMIEKGSLKLRLMAEKTMNNSLWRDESYRIHEEEMINILRESCNNT